MKNLTDILNNPCESPIEHQFLEALIERANARGIECACGDEMTWGFGVGAEIDSSTTLEINPQATFDRYRVDFYIWLRSDPESADSPPSLIVECDGHEYHDRTKRQASRDRARDRHFHSQLYTVFRFTGDDIFNGAAACADQCLDHLQDELRLRLEAE